MKILTINTGWVSQRTYIADNAKADAAYAAIKSAMDAYEKFSNDKEKTVTVDVERGRRLSASKILTQSRFATAPKKRRRSSNERCGHEISKRRLPLASPRPPDAYIRI